MVFANKAPGPAELEAVEMRISSEINALAARSRELHDENSLSSLTASASSPAQVNGILEAHLDAERRLGAEIHPAARSQNFTLEGKADDDCKTSLCTSRSY